MTNLSSSSSLDDIRARLGDRYAIERELGRGGMGAVYLARDLRLDRAVALKVLPPEFADTAGLRERFLRETRTAASFSHPNIVPVHAVEERDGLLAFAMGYVEGESLADRVRRAGPLDARATVRLLQDIGYALAYAHGRGVVHRDIKPDNIMLERATGRAQLMDFGISRSIAATPAGAEGLTRVGEVVGTPEYMSPEQAAGDTVDGRSDIYSLGLVALFAITGRPAFTGGTPQQLLVRQLTEAPSPAASLRADLPDALAAAIDRCVAKQPGDRYATAEALVEAIDSAQLAAPEIPVPVRLFAQEAGTLGLVLAFLVIVVWLMVTTLARKGGAIWAMLPAAVLMAVGLTRVLQVSSSARRLALLGFAPDEVMRGMRATVDEREALRRQIRNDPDTVRRRRITRTIAAIQIPIGLLLIKLSMNVRFSLGGSEQVNLPSPPPGTGFTRHLFVAAAGFALLGVSFLLFARSPFRMPLGERLFRVVWLGPIGRAFVRLSAKKVRKAGAPLAASGVSAVGVAPAPRGAPERDGRRSAKGSAAPNAATHLLAHLEARVAALEEWKATRER